MTDITDHNNADSPGAAQPAWPDHYTAADRAATQRVRAWMEEHKFSQAALARLIRQSPATVSMVLRGLYSASPTEILRTIELALQHADEAAGRAMPVVQTSVYRLASMACDTARRYRNFAMVSAYVGTGKTFAFKAYTRAHRNTYLIEASPTMTPQSLIKQLARDVAGVERGSVADKFDQMVGSLKDSDSLIIVDEAETLTPHQLHTIRRVRDLANIGIVLAGTEHLSGLIRPAHGQFDQIRSRVGFWPEVVRGITAEDAAALTQAALGTEDVRDDVIERLYALSKGSARMLVEGLVAGIREFRKGRPLDVPLVNAVAGQVLGLQSGA